MEKQILYVNWRWKCGCSSLNDSTRDAITRKVPGPVFGRNRTYVDMAARCSKALARSLHRLHIFDALCPICAENREKVVFDSESPPSVDCHPIVRGF